MYGEPTFPYAHLRTNGFFAQDLFYKVTPIWYGSWAPEFVWGKLLLPHVPYYNHLCWADPYWHQDWDVNFPEALHPLDGRIVSDVVVNPNGRFIVVPSSAVWAPLQILEPLPGNEGLFTYDALNLDGTRAAAGSPGLDHAIWFDEQPYGPKTDDFSQLAFDAAWKDKFSGIGSLAKPYFQWFYDSFVAWYKQSWYRTITLFIANYVHGTLYGRSYIDEPWWIDHFFMWVAWIPSLIKTVKVYARIWITDVMTGWNQLVYHFDMGMENVPEPETEEEYQMEIWRIIIRTRVLYLNNDWGFHINFPRTPNWVLDNTNFPTDYANDPRFESGELANFLLATEIDFEVYEALLKDVLEEEEASYNQLVMDAKSEIAGTNPEHYERKMKRASEDKEFLHNLLLADPRAWAAEMSRRRWVYYRTYGRVIEHEIDISDFATDPIFLAALDRWKTKWRNLVFSQHTPYFGDF